MIKWIKTNKQLPELNKPVLCWWGDRAEIFKLNKDGWFENGCLIQRPEVISHWAEIQKPK